MPDELTPAAVREREIRALCRIAKTTEAHATYYVQSEMTVDEIKQELTSFTAREDERIGDFEPRRRRDDA